LRRLRLPLASLGLVALTALAAPLWAAGEQAMLPGSAALLQGLDKTTARISKFEAPIGQPVRFGTLVVTVRSCGKRPPEEAPESAAFLQIDETHPGESNAPPTRIFSGWMFASSPAVSALEHPIYDIGVLDCKIETGSSGSSRKK
jgi:hypothetical protein